MIFSIILQCATERERLLHQWNCSLLQAESEEALGAVNTARDGHWGRQGGGSPGIPAPGGVSGQDSAEVPGQPRQAHYS